MPYKFGDNWLDDASPEDQRKLQDSTVGTLAALHAIDTANADLTFLEFPHQGDTALRRHVNEIWTTTTGWPGTAAPAAHRARFAWIDENWPDDDGTTGAAAGATPASATSCTATSSPWRVLDWEMAATGPRGDRPRRG